MIQLGLSNSAQRGDEYYREQWSAYYSERRRHLARMFWLAGGLGVVFLLFTAVVERHSLLASVLAVPLAILMFALPAQWQSLGGRSGDGPVRDVENSSSPQHLLGIHWGALAVTADLLDQRSRKSTISITKTKGRPRRYRAVNWQTGNCTTIELPLSLHPLLFQACPRGKQRRGQVDGCAEPGGFPEAEDGD